MKNDQKKDLNNGRRDFLRGSLVTGLGAATMATVPGVALAAEDEAPSRETEQKGYRLTSHILEYYKTAAR